jgi:hypothetical protein
MTCFVPRGNEHDQPTRFPGRAEGARINPLVAVVEGHRTPAAPCEVDQVHGKIVEREQQEAR